MSQQGQPKPEPDMNVFDAAKAIVEALKGLDKNVQSLAMRFASEALGLQSTAALSASVSSNTGGVLNASQPTSHEVTHSTDIKQFTAAKAPKSDQQFAAVVAYFYCFEAPEPNRKDTIDAEILQEAARLAGRKRPPKPYMTLTNAKNAGYLDSAGSGKFRINSVGENLVAMALPGNGSEGPSVRRPRKKAVTKKKMPANKIASKATAAKTKKANG